MTARQIVYTTAPGAAAPAPAMKISKRGLPVNTQMDHPLGSPYGAPKATGRGLGGTTHMLICALDYLSGAPSCPLTCTIDGKNIYALAQASGVTDIEFMQNAQCSKEAVIAALKRTAAKCAPGDTFMFFFAGHGMSSTDYDGDEPDGKDENYVCDFSNTQMNPAKHFLSDDELAKVLTSVLNPAVNIIVVSDCCHSGSMCDFERICWKGYNAVSISGCRDTQTSGDTGKGGICTHSLMLAVAALQQERISSYSVQKLFRKTVYFDDTMMSSAQDIQFDSAAGCNPGSVMWPLVPKGPFTAPYKSANGLLPGAGAAGATSAPFAAPAPIAAPSPVFAGGQFLSGGTAAPMAAPSPVIAGGQFFNGGTTSFPGGQFYNGGATSFTSGTKYLPPTTISAAPITTMSSGAFQGTTISSGTTLPSSLYKPAAAATTFAPTTFTSTGYPYGTPMAAPVTSPIITGASLPVSAPATTITSGPGGWL